MKRFACQDIIPGCEHVFTGADDQSVLDQVIAHAAADHGLVKPPLALVELVVATTHNFTPTRPRGHLRLVGAEPATESDQRTDDCADGQHEPDHPSVIHGFPAFPERVGAAFPFQRRGESRRTPLPTGDDRLASRATTAAWPRPPHDTYRHECVFYSGADEFLTAVVPFILDGLALDQPVMVAIAEPRLTAVREALGTDAARVVLLDMAELGSNPASIIPAWRDFVAGTNGQPVRGVGEPIWAGRRAAEIVESQLHEALLNLAVDHHTPLWLMCPYDITALDQAIIDEARRGHPYFGASADLGWSADLSDSGVDYTPHAQSLFAAALPEPVEHPVTMTAGAGNISDVANRVLDAAAAAGLPTQRSAKLAAAVDEVANAGTRNSGAAVTVRLWRDRSALVCEVGDHGTVKDPLVGRGPALSTQSRERGIRLANELCDLVQVRSNSSGTTVRMHSWL
jgi:predicted small metal-binding protein/anti-sigma regulatory factor (Ser/Thr protein kinase)